MLKRLALAAISIGSLAVYRAGEGAGFSVTSVNGAEQVRAGSSLPALAAAMVIFIAYLVALEPERDERPDDTASTARRATAWMLDFLLSFAALSAVIALLLLAGEALATGHFEWRVERTSATALDWLLGSMGIILLFGGMAFYWGLPAARGGQTIGQAVLGLRVVSTTDQPPRFTACLVRGALQPFAPLLWFTRFLSARRSYLHDDLASVRVMTTRPLQRGLTSA